jgi:aromatic-L-amino-acid decarboxylase
MDADEFRKHGKEMVDFIANFWEGLEKRKPMPDVKPGFIDSLVSG